jgi:hypothetical protein
LMGSITLRTSSRRYRVMPPIRTGVSSPEFAQRRTVRRVTAKRWATSASVRSRRSSEDNAVVMSRNLTSAVATGAKCGHLALEGGVEHNAWSWEGDGLTSPERALWRSRRALVELVTVLLHDEAFVANLSEVRSAHDPHSRAWQLARRYGIADRRRLLAALIARGAEHDDLEAAGVAMCDFAARAVLSVDEPRATRRSTYLIGDAFLAPIQYGCELLAAKGSRRRLKPDEERVVRRLVATILQGVRRSELRFGPAQEF